MITFQFQMFFKKSQIFQIRHSSLSKEALGAIADAAIERLQSGMDDEAAKLWAMDEIKSPSLVHVSRAASLPMR